MQARPEARAKVMSPGAFEFPVQSSSANNTLTSCPTRPSAGDRSCGADQSLHLTGEEKTPSRCHLRPKRAQHNACQTAW